MRSKTHWHLPPALRWNLAFGDESKLELILLLGPPPGDGGVPGAGPRRGLDMYRGEPGRELDNELGSEFVKGPGLHDLSGEANGDDRGDPRGDWY